MGPWESVPATPKWAGAAGGLASDRTPLLQRSAGFVRAADTSDSSGFLRCDWVRFAVFRESQRACSDHGPRCREPMQPAAPGRTVAAGYTAVLH
jgi:hypothetical protein